MSTFLKFTAAGLATIALTACVEESSTRQGTGQLQPGVSYDDLRVGSDMAAERGLESRGFVTVDGGESNGFSNLWMYNRNTGQCVQLETADGKVMTINEVTHPKCR
jgi:hypothetical protein